MSSSRPSSSAFACGAFAHLDEERVGLGLGDEADDVGGRGRAGEAECERARGGNHDEAFCSRLPPLDDSCLATGLLFLSIATGHVGPRHVRLSLVEREIIPRPPRSQ